MYVCIYVHVCVYTVQYVHVLVWIRFLSCMCIYVHVCTILVIILCTYKCCVSMTVSNHHYYL